MQADGANREQHLSESIRYLLWRVGLLGYGGMLHKIVIFRVCGKFFQVLISMCSHKPNVGI